MDKDLLPSDLMNLCTLFNKNSEAVKDKWDRIGRELGLSSKTLSTIGQKYKSSRQCFYAMLSAWLHRKGMCKEKLSSVTLRVLVRALRSTEVDESRLAADIIEMKGERPYTEASKTITKSDETKASRVTFMESRQITSLPKPELEDYLREYYRRGSQHQEDEWPPSFNVEYVNLVLMKQNTIPLHKSKAIESVRLITEGDIEKCDGENLNLKDITVFEGRVCLVNGAPGVGKTRLALKLRRDWAGRQLLANFHLVLYFPLREPIARLSENVDELLNYFDENCNKGDRELIKKEQGKGVLFILDGWDELRPSCRGESQFFPKLIKGTILPGCSIIVTSRPGASLDIRNHAHQIIEIQGFAKKQVEEYIQAYFKKSNDDGASKLVDDLQKYPNVASTCYVAINLAIVCHVYHACGYNLPQTRTEVYKWFIIHTVKRYLQKKKVAEAIDMELPPLGSTEDFFDSNRFDETIKATFGVSVRATLQKLGNLALNGLKSDDLCFCRRDLVKTCNLETNDHQFDGFGLLKPIQINHSAGSELYYHFLHLSIQEFIAAFYISQMEESKKMRWLINDTKYDSVIKFFCGIDQFKSQALRIFCMNVKPPVRFFYLECVYEGQWKDYCKFIADLCSNTFKLGDVSHLWTQQWGVLGYVMSNSETQWHFQCYKQFLEEKNLICFTGHLSNNRALYHISLEEVCIKPCAIILFSKICQLQVFLTKLTVINCNLSDEDLLTLLSHIECHSSLEGLCIKDKTVTSRVLDAFLKLLPTLSVIKDIELNFQKFSTENYLAIKLCAKNRCNPSLNIVTSCADTDCVETNCEVLSKEAATKSTQHHSLSVEYQPETPTLTGPNICTKTNQDHYPTSRQRVKSKAHKKININEVSETTIQSNFQKNCYRALVIIGVVSFVLLGMYASIIFWGSSPIPVSRSNSDSPFNNMPLSPPPPLESTGNLVATTQESNCTEIKSSRNLGEILEEIPAHVSNDKLCRYLNIKEVTCIRLERNNNLAPDTIAVEYLHQNIKPCWEDIIRHLCQDFYNMRLAKQVADSHTIPYSKYCSDT